MNILNNDISTIKPISEKIIWDLLDQIPDPEIPVLNILDLGIVRNVICKNNKVIISISPTYSGCPAMDMISMNIRFKLLENGYKDVEIKTVLSPVWTTAWMTENGKKKLKEYGIAPPHSNDNDENNIQCPHCNSINTIILSRFGSTACKALHQCLDCKEPFDYFKCH